MDFGRVGNLSVAANLGKEICRPREEIGRPN